jgi:SAM-dependent methyltransferase
VLEIRDKKQFLCFFFHAYFCPMNEVSKRPWYQEWFNSPFYHKLYFERDEAEAHACIHKLIQHLKPEHGSRMLDVACGRGRHSKALAALGFDVTGVDLSENSIQWAQKFETEKLHFFVHDVRLPFWINYFNYAFNLFTSFGYFRTRREHDNAMRTIAGSLYTGGLFIIDYLNVHYAEDHLVHTEVKQMDTTTFDIRRWSSETHFYKKITITDPALREPLSFTEEVAKFSLGDFTDMLSFQSLQVQEVFGDYQLNPYDIRKTPRMIIIARKEVNEAGDKRKRLYSDGR